MQRVIGKLLIVVGAGLGAWSLVVGGSFSAILLMGYVGTGGREAGGQLGAMVLLTVAGVALGYATARVGRWLAAPSGKDP
jgi:hypothetical protein